MTDQIFDFHLHLCRTADDESRVYYRPGWQVPWYWANEERLSAYLDFWHIYKVVVLNIMDTRKMMARRREMALRDTREAVEDADLVSEMRSRVRRFNRWLLNFAERESRIVPFVMADPVLFGDEIEEELRACLAGGAKGVKMHPGICGHLPSDPRAQRVYAYCERNAVPVLTDTSGAEGEDGVALGAPSNWLEVLGGFPKLQLVLAHLPGERWDEMIELADQYANCWFDIAGGFVDAWHPPTAHRQMPIAEAARVMRRIGIDRILFGSDAPAQGREIVDCAAQVLTTKLTDSEKAQILSGNAVRFFGAVSGR
jgi:predicted TIM-barrel fold metal-dependent hydrolase